MEAKNQEVNKDMSKAENKSPTFPVKVTANDPCRRFWQLFRDRLGAELNLSFEASALDHYCMVMQGHKAGLAAQAAKGQESPEDRATLARHICRVGQPLFFDGRSADAPVDEIAFETYRALRMQLVALKEKVDIIEANPNIKVFPKSVKYWSI